jgi:flagellar biosynthesis protein FlhF
MQTKTYFASSLPAAFEVARRELGENALLVVSKPSPPAVRHFGRLEVTFTWDPNETPGRIRVVPFAEMQPGENRTLAFIGPPGRGKTASMLKIAMNLGLARGVPVRVYCVGTPEPVARFSAILGMRFHACESLTSLNLALNAEGSKGLALIDTPGISPGDRGELGELRAFFTARPEIEKHLVLRADASSADMLHMMSRFSGLMPSRLLFTGMDEAISMTSVIEALARGGIPATFAGTGPRIPEDLEQVNADKLAGRACAGAAALSGAVETTFAQAAA